ncbi:MAG: prepilin-type N-terminal cleavage/methylation domain-containing protein [Rhizobacter sp.]|nr:prepilin-type N-terminal cleavage/methylation domain-containing protein [Rhizobacter sp.]
MRRFQRGLSLVEMMVTSAISLMVVAAALLAFTHQLRASRNILLEARLMQDLRTTTELVAHNLRRAGPVSAAEDGVHFSHAGAEAEMAYRLRAGVIEMKLGESPWQAMTDVNTLRVATFNVTPRVDEIVLTGFCARACAEGSSATCPPRQQLRSLSIHVEARAAHDPAVIRSTRTTVRLRNDALSGACPI